MNIQIGNYKLLSSITVIQIEDLPIIYEFEDDKEGNFSIEINFKEEPGEIKSYTQIKAIDNSHLIITVINQKGNGGNMDLMNIGTYRDCYELYMNIRVIGQLEKSRTVAVNFYIKEQEEYDGREIK